MRITSPSVNDTGVSLTPVITWTDGGVGTTYVLELSTSSSMTNPDSAYLTKAQWQVPMYWLAGATTYYARVTATNGDATAVSDVSSFTTREVIPPVPSYLCPDESQNVLYSTDVVSFEPVEGPGSLSVQISSSESFLTRTSYNGTLERTFETPQLGTIKGAGKLSDGKTYYVRARYAYRTLAAGNTTQYTDYCEVRSFLYRESVSGDVNNDGEVNISDINMVIGIILGAPADEEMMHRADVNGDGDVNIGDINALIAIILSGYPD